MAASVTNNSSSTEQFHFHNEIDLNSGKTLNGRVALSLPLGRLAQPEEIARAAVFLASENAGFVTVPVGRPMSST